MTKMMPDLEGYFRSLAPASDALLLELEAEATRESIPIVGPVVGELLFVLARPRKMPEYPVAVPSSRIFFAPVARARTKSSSPTTGPTMGMDSRVASASNSRSKASLSGARPRK